MHRSGEVAGQTIMYSVIFFRKIGQELSEDERFTKPKHRIIADAYAKRMDDVISVSYQNSYGDPAGLNFDMNNLNVAESDAMGATLTNYLPNIIHRRNAVTTMDYNEKSGNCASSYADNNSEISVNVRQVSIESRRNSIDSQVSQVSFKVSETNIKLNSQNQKSSYKMKMAKRHHRDFFSSKRATRRASNSSAESQRITNQMKKSKYKYRNVANTLDRQIERRSACTTADIKTINDVRNQLRRIQLTSDEDQRVDESQTRPITNEPSNMLVPFGSQQQQLDDSDDSLDTSNDKQLKNAIDFLRNSSEKQFKDLLRFVSEQKECDRSNRKGKSQQYAHKSVYAHQVEEDHMLSEITQNDNDLASSMSSSMDMGICQQMDGSNSSFSDQSMDRMKTQSQNSKHSCDVGIQANDYEIASHRQLRSRSDYDKDNIPEKMHLNYQQEEEYTETHQLLPIRKRESIVRRENLSGKHLSKSQRNELVNKLLMP